MGVVRDVRWPRRPPVLVRDLARAQTRRLVDGIHDDIEAWLRTLHDGGPRSRARGREAAWTALARTLPTLLAWSVDHHHLREITREDVLTVLEGHHGVARHHVLISLRSLFSHCHRRKTIFRNPTARIKVGEHPYRVLQPPAREVEQAITAATTPAARLLVALAAVYGTRPAHQLLGFGGALGHPVIDRIADVRRTPQSGLG